MGNVSYSAHISNGKSAITSKSKLLGVAKHNLRKYKSPEYSSDNILLLRGTEDLYQDVKNVYHQEFDEAVQQYNQKQKRADRRIEDYFEHVANLNQDMAVEIIFQCGDKEFWEEHTDKKEKMYNVYAYLLSTMERFLPNFKVANAVIHFDEASPHMHVVGVPVWEGAKKGLAKKVSKRNVFTPESLSVILQDKLREEAGSCFKFNVKEELAEKKLGRNHDLSVMEYKVVKETERLEELQEQVKDSDLDLFAKKLAYKEVSKTQKEKLDEINKDISSKEAQAEELDYQITIMKSQLYEYEEEASKLEKFKEKKGNDEDIENIKISKGEESNFVWSIFYSLLEQVVSVLNVPEESDRETDKLNQLEYIFIDDPVTSLDDNHLIQMAVNLSDVIRKSESDLKFIITTHSPLFYNVLYNELKIKNNGYMLEKNEDGSYELDTKFGDSNENFSYHHHLIGILKRAIEENKVEKYHFTLLRNLYEKAANFLGYEKWSDLLPDDKEVYAKRVMNFYSHRTLLNEEVKEPTEAEKQTVKLLLEHLIDNAKFWKEAE